MVQKGKMQTGHNHVPWMATSQQQMNINNVNKKYKHSVQCIRIYTTTTTADKINGSTRAFTLKLCNK